MTKRDEITLQAARAMKEAAERTIDEITRHQPRIDDTPLDVRRERIAQTFKPRILR